MAAHAAEAPAHTISTSGQSSESPDFANESEALETMLVEAAPYEPPMTLEEQARLKIHLNLSLNFGVFLSRNDESIVLTPGRVPQRAANVGYTTTVLVNREFTGAESASLESALHHTPELSLSGPSRGPSMPLRDERVLLRGLRATVLRDGVPLNNPFSGVVPWFALAREGLARAEVVAGGGSTAWGNGALGGVVQLFTRPAIGRLVTETKPKQSPEDPTEKRWVIHRTGTFVAEAGERESVNMEFAFEEPMADGVLQILGQASSTGGAHVVAREQRGAIDAPGWNRRQWLEARWRQPLSADLDLTVTGGTYHGSRGRGTAYQQDRARRNFASLAFAGSPSQRFAWNGVAYVDDSTSANTLSLVNVDRDGEIPWIDQFAVPASAFGASLTGAWWASDNNSRTTAGLDFRTVLGNARQHTDFANGVFTRERVAGGKQSVLGLSLLRHQYVTRTWRASLGVRLDASRDWNGHRRETDRLTGAVLRDERDPGASQVESSPSLGVVWHPHKEWRVHANGQRASRRPTLGERYQTFGGAGIITEASPELRTEDNTSFELGAAYTPSRALSLTATAFTNQVSNLISSLRVTDTTRARINSDAAHIDGVRVGIETRPNKSVTIAASALWSKASIDRFDLASGLVGNQLPEIPRRTAVVSATWQARKTLLFSLRLSSLGRRFADLENTAPLNHAVVTDVGASFALSGQASLFLTVENITDADVETFRDSNGVTYVGSPRTISGGVRAKW